MRLKPSCSWCKDQTTFKENKKFRILINCFKCLCSYVSNSSLGAEISKASINGFGSEAERTLNVLKEAELFHDDIVLTPPPKEFPIVSKSMSGGIKSTKNLIRLSSTFRTHDGVMFKRKRGRPKTIIHADDKKRTLSEQIKKIKKKAIGVKSQNLANQKYSTSFSSTNNIKKSKRETSGNPVLLIAQRPHRDRSGKYSVGQLWRETFLEEAPHPEPDPDSGIEIGNSSDQDHTTQLLSTVNKNIKETSENVKINEVHRKDTRCHKNTDNDRKGAHLQNGNDSSNLKEEAVKPRLMLTISKKRFQNMPRRNRNSLSVSPEVKELTSHVSKSPSQSTTSPSALPKKMSLKSTVKQRSDICKCARFKMPNHLTCFGQKCPCYSEKKSCIDCLCNGCKNPLKVADAAPPLMHIIGDTDSLDHSFDRSMPRLSPIPKI
ncbi:E3 ubiquitin-protein ligase MSL2 [Biomphalaria glabrata]|nr:E3 ubiquitin-protein ligase MSL2 [Biomphalaria glabrata]